jgi:hypothetical protein
MPRLLLQPLWLGCTVRYVRISAAVQTEGDLASENRELASRLT